MANRVLLGPKGGAQGLYISKPGHDVVTTGESNLLFSSDWSSIQVVKTGTLNVSNGGSAPFSIPVDLGFKPAIMLVPEFELFLGPGLNIISEMDAHVTYHSNTSFSAHVWTKGIGYTGKTFFAVFKVNLDG